MVQIKVEIPGINVAGVADAIQAEVEATLLHLADYIRDDWIHTAEQKLLTTKESYVSGLMGDDSIEHPFQGDPLMVAIVLKGPFPNMIEDGFNAFNMKPGFRESQFAKTKKKGGWYLTIPLRHLTPTPGTVGTAIASKVMPKDIYEKAKEMEFGDILLGTEKKYPPQMHEVYLQKEKRTIKYQRKHGRYEGMIRSLRPHHHHYMTFRRVSDKSEETSWYHPGFTGAHIAEEVASRVDSLAETMFAKFR